MCWAPSDECFTSSDLVWLAFSFAGELKETGSLPEALQHEFCYENTYAREKVKDISLDYYLLMSSHVGAMITSRQGCIASLGLLRSPFVQASHSQCRKSLKSCLDLQLMVNTSATDTKCREDIAVCVYFFLDNNNLIKIFKYFFPRVSWQFETLILLLTCSSLLCFKTAFCGLSFADEVQEPTVRLFWGMAPVVLPWQAGRCWWPPAPRQPRPPSRTYYWRLHQLQDF